MPTITETVMDNSRLIKIGTHIRKDLGEMLLGEFRHLVRGTVVTVTEVRVSPDLGYARVYFSVFPFARAEEIMAALNDNIRQIRGTLGRRMRNQLRIIPELTFVLDETAEQIQKIDDLLK